MLYTMNRARTRKIAPLRAPRKKRPVRSPKAKGRATGAEIGVLAHVSTDRLLARDSGAFDLVPLPQEPDGDAPLDELLAYGEVLESLA